MATAHHTHSTISIIHSTISIIHNGYYKKNLQDRLKQLNVCMHKAEAYT